MLRLMLLLALIQISVRCHDNDRLMINNSDEQNILDNVFDWVFGEPDNDHELEHHFGYLRGAGDNNDDLSQLARTLGIKPEFFNFKAHDYDNNDRIDGLELLAMFLHERNTGNESSKNGEQTINLCASKSNFNHLTLYNDFINLLTISFWTEAIDRLLEQEDRNRDGYLDFSEYAQARQRIAQIQANG